MGTTRQRCRTQSNSLARAEVTFTKVSSPHSCGLILCAELNPLASRWRVSLCAGQRRASLAMRRVQRAGGLSLLRFGSLVTERISHRPTVDQCVRFARARCRNASFAQRIAIRSACRQALRQTARVPPDGSCCATGAAMRRCRARVVNLMPPEAYQTGAARGLPNGCRQTS